MSNEQKLREVLRQALTALENVITQVKYDEECAAAIIAARQALATTEPEPTGMPELPDADVLFEDGKDQYGYTEYGHAFSFQRTKAYGEQCWKAGYKHGAWGGKPTSKQSLQVEPAVNQQLTTEPVDEREAFERWLGIKPCGAAHDFGWAAWQARAAMAQGAKG